MVLFAYNNAKNVSISHTLIKLNCSYHFYLFYKEDFNPYSKFKILNKLASKLEELITFEKKFL